jgi:hypothetical protein
MAEKPWFFFINAFALNFILNKTITYVIYSVLNVQISTLLTLLIRNSFRVRLAVEMTHVHFDVG